MDPKNIDDLIAQDIRIIFLLEYIPPSPLNTLLLTPEQRREFRAQILEFRKIKPCALFAHPDEVSNLAQLVGAYKTNMNLEE